MNKIDPEGNFMQIIGGFAGGAIAGGIYGAMTNAIIAYVESGGDWSVVAKKAAGGAITGAIIGGVTGAVLSSGLSPLALSLNNPFMVGLEYALVKSALPGAAAIFFNALTWQFKNPEELHGSIKVLPCD